jgi:hypothetical protein
VTDQNNKAIAKKINVDVLKLLSLCAANTTHPASQIRPINNALKYDLLEKTVEVNIGHIRFFMTPTRTSLKEHYPQIMIVWFRYERNQEDYSLERHSMGEVRNARVIGMAAAASIRMASKISPVI